jgi:APA family basic amino acid/polyamine antiporter
VKQEPRQIGFWMCVALVVGNIVGGGIFLMPTSLAPLGLNSVLGWVLSSAGAILLARFSILAEPCRPPRPYAYTHAPCPLAAF